MSQEMTSEQKNQLKTWVEQRDALLLEISGLREDKEKLQKVNNELAESNTEIYDRMNVIQGRIIELQAKEEELFPLISKDIAELKTKKAVLEAEIPLLKKAIEPLEERKTELEADVKSALFVFENLKENSLVLEKIIDQANQVGGANAEKVRVLVDGLTKSLEELVAVNKKNVEQTSVVIEQLPAMLVEARKQKLIKNKI